MKFLHSLLVIVGMTSFLVKAVNIEVELKFSLDEEQQCMLEKWLDAYATCKGEVFQSEDYLTNPACAEWNYDNGFKDTMKTFRIRRSSKGNFVCHKYCHLGADNRVTHRDEYETKIEDPETVLAVLKALVPDLEVTHIEKIRTTYVYENFEIVLDDVKNVGTFVEIEMKSQIDDIEQAQQQLLDFMRFIGITHYIEYTRSYVHMLWNPGYNFGIEKVLE